MRGESGASLLWVATVLLAVALLVPFIRGVTITLNNSLGRTWPFSYAHCIAKTTPGCDEGPARAGQATR